MASNPPPALVLGRLADERRLRVLAAVVLGANRVADIAEKARLSEDVTARSLAQLVGTGIVFQGETGLEVDLDVFAEAARAASTPRKRPALADATPAQVAVLRNFVDGNGRITALPARAAKRRLVLEYVAGRLETDREYAEREINGQLLTVYDDVASLRRFLVDEGLLERDAGVYRRVNA